MKRVLVAIGRNRTRAEPYTRALEAVGLEPLVISSLQWKSVETRSLALQQPWSGIVLCGGGDIDPKLWTPQPPTVHPRVEGVDGMRDDMERRIFLRARAEQLPALGICRGMQVMNWTMGGTLFQDIDDEIAPLGAVKKHRQTEHGFERHDVTHDVTTVPGTRLASILGEGTMPVNSIHHQAVKDLAPGLVPSAWSPDGVLEGLEAPDDPFTVGVQWHPECLWDRPGLERFKALFKAFADAARELP